MSDFATEFLEEMKPVALDRIKGGLLWRLMFRRAPRMRDGLTIPGQAGLKFSRASYFTAIHEAGERMAPSEREAWRKDGTLPDGFWRWVETRAASWDSLPG